MKALLFLFLILAPLFSVKAQELKAQIDPSVERILKNYGIKKEHLFYSFIPLNNKKNQTNYQSEIPFIPASVSKVFTALYALKNLGPDFRYKTMVYKTGKIEDGVLKGDLILKGTGDPSLTLARLMDLVLEVRALGIKKVEGNLFYDDSLFPPTLMLSEFGAGDQTYNPGLSALNLEYNRMSIYRKGSTKARYAEFIALPPLDHIKIEKTDDEFPIGQNFLFKKDNPGEVWQLNNKKGYRLIEEVPVRRTSRRTAESFRHLLELWGIQAPPSRFSKTPKDALLVAEDRSASLINLLALTLEYSNNLYAEQILLTSSKKTNLKEAAKVMSEWIKERVPECKEDLVNGSGLTTEHKITAHCLSQFLANFAFVTSEHKESRGFMSLLSINGQSGWLKSRLKKPETSFRIWAKTGSLDYVSNIAGVLFTLSGKAYAFTLSLNDSPKRERIDLAQGKKPSELKKKERRELKKWLRGANRWSRKAKEASDKLLEHFIQTL